MFLIPILFIVIFSIIISIIFHNSKLINVEAFNNKQYIVNDLEDAQEASNILAHIMITLDNLVSRIISDYDKGRSNSKNDKIYIENIRKIKKNLPNVKISETPITSKFTSYSINKGEELVLCIRDKKTRQIQNINEALYVAIHEIAHIGCPEIGHTLLFRNINAYLLEKAVCYGLYKYIDYFENNKDYCGIKLTSTIISDNIKCQKN